MKPLDRRQFMTTSLAAGTWLGIRTSFAAPAAPTHGQSRLVFIILRGALDGLAAVPPVGDPDYVRLRRDIAVPAPGCEGGAIALDSTFGLHPSLHFMGDCWQAKQLAVLHAVATPYRERSHFDAQDVLESGYSRPHAAQTGWLNRALASWQGSTSRNAGVALGSNIPLVMRGPAEVASWSPSRLDALDEDTLQRLGDLYAHDPLLASRLADAMSADAIAAAEGSGNDMAGGKGRGAQLAETIRAAAGFLRREDGPRVAVLDTTGWDTHANEGVNKGQLALRLAALDGGLKVLRESLGDTWDNTAVLIATEFGRTAAVNGTNGTDHGTGAAAFLVGGAVHGGRVIADWPGLSPGALYENRDLKPTTDLRSVMKSLLRDHLGVAQQQIDREVFPDSNSAPYIGNLV